MSQDRVRAAAVWLYGTFAYCLVVAVVAGLRAPHHSFSGPMPALVRSLLAPAMLSFGAQAIYAGQVHVRWGAPVARDERPIVFWMSVGVYMAMGCYLLFSGVQAESPQ
jgi:hypothetical protein